MKKRFVSLITVFLCLILLGSILGVSVQAKETIDCVYEENFENGTGKWEKFGSSSSGTLTTATSEKINGSKSLVLYNRVNTWDSPALDLLNVLKNSGGGTYVVNLWVYVENLPELVSPARLLLRADNASKNISIMENHNGNYFKAISCSTTLTFSKGLLLTGSFMLTDNDLKSGGKLLLCLDQILGDINSNLYIDDVKIYRLSDYDIDNDDFSNGIAGWRSWGGDGLIFSGSSVYPEGAGYYAQSDQYSSMAYNVNQILDYYGSGTYTLRFSIKLQSADPNETQKMRFYLTRDNDEYHYNIGYNKQAYTIRADVPTDIVLTFNTDTVPSGKNEPLYSLLSPDNNEVHFRMQRENELDRFTYSVDNVTIQFHDVFSDADPAYGRRYVSTYKVHKVNGISMAAKAFGSSAPTSSQLSRIDLLSAVYESSDNPGKITNSAGDIGGASYGTYQFTVGGSLPGFMNWMRTQNQYAAIYNQLSSVTLTSAAFNEKWTNCANNNSALFRQAQYEYAKSYFFDYSVNLIRSNYNFDITSRSKALQNMIFALSIHLGRTGVYEKVFTDVFSPNTNFDLYTDKEIMALLTERITRTNVKDDSPDVTFDDNYHLMTQDTLSTEQYAVAEQLNATDKYLSFFGSNGASFSFRYCAVITACILTH